MHRFSHILLFLFSVLTRVSSQSEEPVLRLNSNFHTAAIHSISTDNAGRYLLTVSEDKTARLWDTSTGNSLRIFRPPIGNGLEGCLYACALSPNGLIAAVGGYTGATWNKPDSFKISLGSWEGYALELKFSVYLFSTSTGEMLKNIDNFKTEIQSLSFSPEGEYLAVALAEDKGISIIRTKDGKEVHKLIGFSERVSKVTFSNSGQLACISDDHYLRLYSKTFQLKSIIPLEVKPTSVAFSKDEKTIAVGYSEISQITLIQLPEGTSTKIDLPLNSYAVALTYTDDGVLYSGEFLTNGKNLIVAWKNGKRTEIDAGTGKITDLNNLPDGSVVYATSYPETGRILANNQPAQDWNGNRDVSYKRSPDLRAIYYVQPELIELNDDGSEVGLFGDDNEMFYFSLSEREFSKKRSYLSKPVSSRQNVRLIGWKNGNELFLNFEPLFILDKEEISRCVDISGDGKNILLGTNQNVLLLDNHGNVIWKQTVTVECVAVKISGNGKVAVIAMNDGVYAWYNISDGKRLLNLFVHPDQKRWILWTPAGFYDCSAGAEDLIGWNLNRGKDKASVFFPAAQFRNSFYRPETIDYLVGNKYNMQYAQYETIDHVPAVITQSLPPEINIITPLPGSSANKRQIKVQYNVNSQSDKPVNSVKILVNGRPVQLHSTIRNGSNEVMVEIPENDCEISLIAQNDFASSVPATISLKWAGAKIEDIIKPKLYILAIGISKYKDKSLTLQFAAKDASDFANIMYKQKGFLYSEVSIKLLTDEKSKRSDIQDGLDWILSETTSRDVAMIFFAGHGVNDNLGTFYFMPEDADRNRLRATCVNYYDIQQCVSSIAGKVVLFMDACHSGGVMGRGRRSDSDIIGFVNELSSAENGIVVFTSSTGKQFSLEDPEWNNGAFTKALVEGLSGKADLLNKGKISIKLLDYYVSERVKELTKGKQAPTTIIPESIQDFPIIVLE